MLLVSIICIDIFTNKHFACKEIYNVAEYSVMTQTKGGEHGSSGLRWKFKNHLVTENPFAGCKYLENTSNKIRASCIDV